MSEIVYKLVGRAEWAAAKEHGEWAGSAVDVEDGFIHLSTAAQLSETARLHFAGRSDLLLLGVRTDKVELKWEPARGGQLFPHLYGPLPIDAVAFSVTVPVGEDGLELPTLTGP